MGLMGKLAVYDDGICEVNGYCKPDAEERATAAEPGYRVLKRIHASLIAILLK
nr:hypothetical protein [Paenibacillus catalpae]